MSNFTHHESCPTCKSSDGRACYDDGNSYCFSCSSYFSQDGKETTRKNLSTPLCQPFAGNPRKIPTDIANKFGYYYNEDKTEHIEVHRDKDGKVCAYKFRDKSKTFKWSGSAKEAMPYGMHLWRSGGKSIVITEGVIDCLSVSTAFDGRYPVVSINNGAGSAYKEIKQHLEYFSSFNKVVLALDADDVGQEAVEKILPLFRPNQVFVMSYRGLKDANELLVAEGKGAVLSAYYEAKIKTPSGIVLGGEITTDELLHPEETCDASIPYKGLDKMLYGLRGGSVVLFTAGSGAGKSTICREIAYDLKVNQGKKIGIIALEENNRNTALNLIGIGANKPLHLKHELEAYDEAEFTELKESIIDDNIVLYNHFGSVESDGLISTMRFMRKALDVDYIVLDHISIAISGLDNDNERKAIDVMMTNIRSLAEETGVGILLVSHIKRIESGKQISMTDLRGSASLEQLSDAIVALERDVEAGETEVTIRVLKNRYASVTGLAGKAEYDFETGRLNEILGTPNEEVKKKGAKKDDTNTTKSPF